MHKQPDEELLDNSYFGQLRETFLYEIAINGSPKVTVPEDNLVVSSMIQLSKEQEETRDKEVHHHLRNANLGAKAFSSAAVTSK